MLNNKTILLVSPQSWGNMFIAKHHYAIELAKLGNTVYFLNPPDPAMLLKGAEKRIRIEQSTINSNLFIIHHHLFYPYIFKFKAKGLFLFLMRFHIKAVLKKMEKQPDIIWSFDLGNLYPFSFFPANAYKIFHPVDEPTTAESLKCGKGANIIFSVTNEILEGYKQYNVPRIFVHHGVSDEFFSNDKPQKINDGKVRVGVSGNFLRPDIDREIFLQVIDENPNVQFECWGAYENKQTNIGGDTLGGATVFIDALKTKLNVLLHGPVNTARLAKDFQQMDAFLICYDVNKDASKGTNYHKIMEYLSTGKVIVSNNVTTYKDRPDLVQMVTERTDNKKLPALFKEVITHLDKYNATELRQQRIEFAMSNRYSNKPAIIDQYITQYSGVL